MPPVSTHFSHSAFATLDLADRDTITVGDQEFRVIKLESRAYVESPYVKEKKKATTIQAKIKELPEQVKRDYKLAKKLELMPENIAMNNIAKTIRKGKEDELREELGFKHLHIAHKREHAERLRVGLEEVMNEWDRLSDLVRTIESSLDL